PISRIHPPKADPWFPQPQDANTSIFLNVGSWIFGRINTNNTNAVAPRRQSSTEHLIEDADPSVWPWRVLATNKTDFHRLPTSPTQLDGHAAVIKGIS